MKLLTLLLKVVTFSSALFFINCSGMKSITPKTLSQDSNQLQVVFDTSLNDSGYSDLGDMAHQKYPNEYTCAVKSNTNSAVTAGLQKCFDQAPEYSKILLAPGKYKLDSGIRINKPLFIGTKGLDTSSSSPCDVNDMSRCAVFMLSVPMNNATKNGVFHIQSSAVYIDHVVVDGDKGNSVRNVTKMCNSQTGQRYLGNNMTLEGQNFVMTNSVIRNSPCSTGFEVARSAVGFNFVNNVVANNGIHNINERWADGLTVHDNSDAEVSHNLFINNTDVDLIFGGCQRCAINENRIVHDTTFAGSSFAALMIHAWPGGSGDFTNSEIRGNMIDCGSKKRCGFGLYIGADAWYQAPTFGGVVRDNDISNAMLGLNIDQATGKISVFDNIISNSGGEYLTACGKKNFSEFNISPESLENVDLNGDSVEYSMESYDGCIPNWWTEDSVTDQARIDGGNKEGTNLPEPTPQPSSPNPTPSPSNGSSGSDTLLPNESLKAGESIISGDGSVSLIYQNDGNLVLYSQGKALWSSLTPGTSPGQAVMQGDGNFVVYDSNQRVVFTSKTDGYSGARLIVQSDGNLVLYDTENKARWATNTNK